MMIVPRDSSAPVGGKAILMDASPLTPNSTMRGDLLAPGSPMGAIEASAADTEPRLAIFVGLLPAFGWVASCDFQRRTCAPLLYLTACNFHTWLPSPAGRSSVTVS